MFKKVHLRLTLLFTIVTTLILTIMSVFYIYTSNRSLYKNALLSFQSDINTFTMSFEKDSSVSYDWLLNLQSNYEYLFYLYDNGIPLRFTYDTKTEPEQQLIEDIRHYYQNNISPLISHYTAEHQEFSYEKNGNGYHVSVITIPGENGGSEIFVIHSLAEIEAQLHTLYFRFGMVIILSIAALFAFSWLYTKKLLKPIQESQEKQSQFIAAASHEIRNPVNTILSALGAMEKGTPEQQREFASIAGKEGKRLARLTNGLLTLARSDNHSFQTTFGRTELDTLVLECYEAFSAPAREKEIKLSVELSDDILVANHVDSERMKQVIAILLDNAISYTPEGGTVILRCRETIKAYCIEVADNGIGIDDTAKKRIYDRFYRADDSRTSKSHFGLGLSIAKEIVELHHGTISVSDTNGGGATFRVTLPK